MEYLFFLKIVSLPAMSLVGCVKSPVDKEVRKFVKNSTELNRNVNFKSIIRGDRMIHFIR